LCFSAVLDVFSCLYGLVGVVSVLDRVKAWFDSWSWLLYEKTVVSTGFLAQASYSRLGENIRGSPRFLLRDLSPRRRAFFLSEECSHLGEKGLAWARPRMVPCSLVAPSPEREGPSRLSEPCWLERDSGRVLMLLLSGSPICGFFIWLKCLTGRVVWW